MAGWVDSTGTGRGAGGRGFPNRRGDTIQGGGGAGSSSGGFRWRGRGRTPQQPNFRYRPVDTTHRQSSSSARTEPPTASVSAQATHPAAARGKSPAPGAVAPAGSNKDAEYKGSRNAANFECNVCFDMAAEPVVTKCGHLFCWECLYQWLHVHSQHRECPVCKGQVAEDAVIPIYGRGGSAASVDTAIHNAPPRPTGARVESSRQQERNNHQPHTWPYQMVYVDDGDEDEEENPFEFPSIENIGFGGTSLRDAFARSFMSTTFDDVDMDEHYDEFEYSYEFSPEDFDEIYDYDPSLMGFPVLVPADNPSSSQVHSELFDLTGSVISPVDHREYGYSGPNTHNRGQHRRRRTRASANQSGTDAMVTGGSSGFHLHHDNSANYYNGSAGAPSRPNGGWAERRGRSNRNSNSAGGRGVPDDRRQRTHYS